MIKINRKLQSCLLTSLPPLTSRPPSCRLQGSHSPAAPLFPWLPSCLRPHSSPFTDIKCYTCRWFGYWRALPPLCEWCLGEYDSLRLKNSFRNVGESVYKAETHAVPFLDKPEECRTNINNWVEDLTAGKIQELLPPESISNRTQLVLGNAMYFKGLWYEKFNPSYTKINTFDLIDGRSVETPFMTSEEDQFIEDYDDFQVLRLLYEQGRDSRQFSFYIFLPYTFDGLSELSMKMSSEPDFLNRHIPKKRVPVGDFRIPKFKISHEMEFSKMFASLGLDLPFKPTKDFSEMVEYSPEFSHYKVSQISHKCFVEVDEEGTEAAAASAAECRAYITSVEHKIRVDFVADHPFLFLTTRGSEWIGAFYGTLAQSS